MAMAALREENLLIARLDEPTRVKLVSDHRRNLVCERWMTRSLPGWS
ncbi:hypothetical protein GFS60_06921 (plasmid) [Rhodococcus sp. WAY2]|nr:hypothetical protein GFS60_06921 [Rhodococcus sp. WAY2]